MKGKRRRITVHVTNTQKTHPLSCLAVRRYSEKVLKVLHLRTELSIALVGNRQIRKINRRYHHTDCTTDVLAFEMPSRWPCRHTHSSFLGDVIISVDQTNRNAERFGVPAAEELIRYIIHGILHLLGERDRTHDQQAEMFRRQERILQAVCPVRGVFIRFRGKKGMRHGASAD